MRVLAALPYALTLGLGAGCASGSSSDMHSFGSSRVQMEDVATEPAAPPPAPERKAVSMDEHAKTYRNAMTCEQAARGMREFKPKKAWALLMACADRDDFTHIDRLLNRPWLAEVKRRPKGGAKLMSRLISNRGGNLKLDLAIVNDRGVQLFDLATAMKSGKVFRGRFILLRAKLLKVAPHGHGVRLDLAETSLQAQNIKERWSYSRAYKERRKGRSRKVRSRRDDRGKRKKDIIVNSLTVSNVTGRRLTAFASRSVTGLKVGEERLFLVKFDEGGASTGVEGVSASGKAAFISSYQPLEAIQ